MKKKRRAVIVVPKACELLGKTGIQPAVQGIRKCAVKKSREHHSKILQHQLYLKEPVRQMLMLWQMIFPIKKFF